MGLFFHPKPCSQAWFLSVFRASSTLVMAFLEDTSGKLGIQIQLPNLVNSMAFDNEEFVLFCVLHSKT